MPIVRRAVSESLRNCSTLRERIRSIVGEKRLADEVEHAGKLRGSLTGASVFALANILRRPIVCFNSSQRERRLHRTRMLRWKVVDYLAI